MNSEMGSVNTSTQNIMATYQRLDVTFSHGEGPWLFDTQGKRYLDALCGISVTNLGHNHSAVTAAIISQASKLLHTSNLYHIQNQEALATRLCDIASMDTVFFANSGAEANEAAIKLARLHAHNRGIENPSIITFSGSFHGRTLATLAATGNKKIKQGFAPLPTGFIESPWNDINAINALFESHDNIAAVLLEPVQGESGIQIADAKFLKAIESLCHKHKALFMVDEVQSGNGRCGRYFAHQINDLSPDVITTAKGLGNGVPIGACLARGDASTTLSAGKHGSTFGGNPLATAAALAVVNTICENHLDQRATELGSRITSILTEKLSGNQHVLAIRQLGLMIGIQLDQPCGSLVAEALNAGLLINVAADSVVRLLPPLILDNDQADLLAETVANLINQFPKTQ